MIRVLLVDDSAVARMHMRQILATAADMQVVGMAKNGSEALEMVAELKPDVVSMDLDMPGIDGYQAARTIMETAPIPIVVVCGLNDTTAKAVTLRALEAGAVAVLSRPPASSHPDFARSCTELLDTLRTSSEVRLVRRWRPKTAASTFVPAVASPTPMGSPVRLNARAVVAIAASTGGPVALMELLSGLPSGFPLPICIVQHIAEGFTESMAQWLDKAVPLSVGVAQHGERLRAGRVLLAPHGRHMEVDAERSVRLHQEAAEYGMIPAGSVLFRSVAAHCAPQALGVVLTGMGADGAIELGRMRQAGALTFAQDSGSALVFGMPGEAVRLGAASYVMPPSAIAVELCRLTSHL